MAAWGAPGERSPGWDPPAPTPIRRLLMTRESPYHPPKTTLLGHSSTFSFELVSPVAQGSRYTSLRGESALYGPDGSATRALALQLRADLPGVTSMRQIQILADTMDIRLIITANEATPTDPAFEIRLDLPGVCDSDAVGAKWSTRTRVLRVMLPLMPTQDPKAVRRLMTINSLTPESPGVPRPLNMLPTRLFSDSPRDGVANSAQAGDNTTEYTAPVDLIRAPNGSMVGTSCGLCSSCSTPQVPADQTALCGATTATCDAGSALAESPVIQKRNSIPVTPAGAAGPPLALASELAGATSSFGDTRPDHAMDNAAYADTPSDATTEGLCALHHSLPGSTVTRAAAGIQASGNNITEYTAPVDLIQAPNGSMVGTSCETCSSCSTPQVPADQTALCGATREVSLPRAKTCTPGSSARTPRQLPI